MLYDVKYSQEMASCKWWSFINGTTEFESFWIKNKHRFGTLKGNSLLKRIVIIYFFISWIIILSITMITNNMTIGMILNIFRSLLDILFIVVLIIKQFPPINVDMFRLRQEFIYIITSLVSMVFIHVVFGASGLTENIIVWIIDMMIEW